MSEKQETAPPSDLSVNLSRFHGVVIHQQAQPGEALAQAFGLPFEAKNKYIVSPMPEGSTVVRSTTAPDTWKPSFEDIKGLPELFVMKEKSDVLTRICFTCLGCRAMRPLDVQILESGRETTTRMTKPCKCGGWIGCPLEMFVDNAGNHVGHVRENFDPYCSKCVDCCFCCSFYHHVHTGSGAVAPTSKTMDRDGESEPKYELKFHLCCTQGESNNCCGATCFNHNAIFEIRDPKSGEVIGNIQKLYAPSVGGGGAACCRCLFSYDTFAIRFPEGSSHEDRLMLIAGILQAEFQLFEADQDE